MKQTLIDRIYDVGYIIATKFSADIPASTPILYGIFDANFKANMFMGRSEMFSCIFAIEAQLDTLGELTEEFGVIPDVYEDLKERIRILFEYEYWESVDLFINCTKFMLVSEWRFLTIKSG